MVEAEAGREAEAVAGLMLLLALLLLLLLALMLLLPLLLVPYCHSCIRGSTVPGAATTADAADIMADGASTA